MEYVLFEEVGDVVRGLVPSELGVLRLRAHRYGIKVWFGPERPTREHYEAQVVGPDGVPGAKILALEVGFHAENTNVADNDAAIARLQTSEKQWRRTIGDVAFVGPFLGRADSWRRISETWPDPNLDEADLAFEIGARLTDYITALEPLRIPR